ncbi:hypothetical protein [Sediminibacterium ginsengisoli]|uniref:SpoIIAA-like n=1 Tax=Sediminibacterium ginsengisoli TaxID=413434 RepID=A0A1T4JP59_9BACT|nr:hypothetical protein [Sediminibacterium ginsengisoli]SJZ31954.1 hypothetical protein SAMN04488132_10116 [Sediminibacterium ginsengisoli]
MVSTKITASSWHSEKRLLITHISGDIEKEDIEQWEASFRNALDQIEDNSTFKIFINMHGFKAVNLDAHKRFRAVIPLTLADYGWKTGYLGLFEEEAKTMTFKNTRGIQCVGAAHSHQDETKMELYETRFSSDRERFFTNPEEAMQWIDGWQIPNQEKKEIAKLQSRNNDMAAN